ncbi:MAG: Gfo/Idh/MocA family oxidoreductase, partial [Candidatus Poribacteria bacterium]|nr:Gfo/Idh/MocA family oxidoreductase [Candidatus Poribacteria bacterium]
EASMSKLNIALVGAGRRGGSAHLPVIAKLKHIYNLVAICDIDEEVATHYAQQYGATPYTHVRDLVEHEALDVVDITVPALAHHAIACFMADAGVHILCETPITVTLPTADLMIERAKANNVKLEIAENYYRVPRERFLSKVIEADVIGEVARIYRIFHEGGHHGMSMLRLRAGGEPKSMLGITQTSPVIPIIDRMKRNHTSENWSLAFIEFHNNATALMVYSNVIHARSLGRGQTGISQIDGSKGTIVGEDIYVTPADDLQSGALGIAYRPKQTTIDVDGVEVIEKIELQLPEQTVTWENPLKNYPISERQMAVADELLSIATAVLNDTEPEYGAVLGRQDQEMNIAMNESGNRSREAITFPLTDLTATERDTHESYQQQHGHPIEDIEAGVDTFFPRR